MSTDFIGKEVILPRKSKYEDSQILENNQALFPRLQNPLNSTTENINKSARKVWYIGKYIRLSKEDGDDKDESNSVISQDKILDELIMELAQNSDDEFVVYDTYIDDGYSGTDFNRPDFQRILKDMKDCHINMIATKDLSRLGRNYI